MIVFNYKEVDKHILFVIIDKFAPINTAKKFLYHLSQMACVLSVDPAMEMILAA